jgi:hypothetical protein
MTFAKQVHRLDEFVSQDAALRIEISQFYTLLCIVFCHTLDALYFHRKIHRVGRMPALSSQK